MCSYRLLGSVIALTTSHYLRWLRQSVLFLLSYSVMMAASAGQTYYVCDSGSDTHDGLSPARAIQSYAKAAELFNHRLKGGGKILFCRGGVFPIQQASPLYNPHCLHHSQSPCVLADYGLHPQRPRLIAFDTHGIQLQDKGTPDPDGHYQIKNLAIVSQHHRFAGIFLHNMVSHVVIDNVYIAGFATGVQEAGANKIQGNVTVGQSHITIRNSMIRDNAHYGWLGGCDHCHIINNTFVNNGFSRAIFNHNIYLTSHHGMMPQSMVIRGNTLSQSAIVDEKCQGVSLVAHGVFRNLVIEHNVITEAINRASPHCWGISIDPGYPREEGFYQTVIRHNHLSNVGNIAIGCASCVGLTISDNTIEDHSGQLLVAIKVPVKPEDSIKSRHIRIENNQIVLKGKQAIGIEVEAKGPLSVNNNTITRPMTSTQACIMLGSGASVPVTASNHCLGGAR